nr:uncharacterized protein LOC109155623 isoform X3 [Ipomoea trifida]
MARPNGRRRNKRRASGFQFSPSSSGSAGAGGFPAHAWSFKRRSFRWTPPSAVRQPPNAATTGGATGVSARQEAARRGSGRGQDTHQPVVISDGDDGSDDEFQTAPRDQEIPLRMGYWLLSNFDPAGMALKLANGSSITITKEDVATVLGLPNGIVPITERDGPIVGPELRAWRDKVNQRRGKITVRALGTLLLELK